MTWSLRPDLDVFEIPYGLGLQIKGRQHPIILRGKHVSPAWAYLKTQLATGETLKQMIEQCSDPDLQMHVRQLIEVLKTQDVLFSPSVASDPSSPADLVQQRQQLFWNRLGFPDRLEEVAPTCFLASGLFGAICGELLFQSGVSPNYIALWDDDGAGEAYLKPWCSSEQLVKFATTDPSGLTTQLSEWRDELGLIVCCTRQGSQEIFAALNTFCLEEQKRWIYANEEAGTFRIGPTILPRQTACYTCMTLRQSSRDPLALETILYEQARGQIRSSGQTSLRGELLAGATMAASLVVVEVLRILQGQIPQLLNTQIHLEPWELRQRMHRLLPVPRCPSCYAGHLVLRHV
ncbi:MAG: TOMM precursor leader peptide-binding protein [Synechococcaceae cyanobacterium SM2_3_1]|nr:TOMM precursor leader peptide-binding protein [Synechococcaceae cyanobacterium SM2_3_1]